MFLFNKLTALLPAALRPYAKAVYPALVASVSAGVAWVTRGVFDPVTLTAAGYGALHSILTLLLPNLEKA